MNAAPLNPNAYEASDDLVLDDGFDPLVCEGADHDETVAGMAGTAAEAERAPAPDEEDVLPYLGDPDANHIPEVVVDDRPASVRTEELFSRMKPRRRVLLGVLDLCREPAGVDAVNARIDELQSEQRSVFDGAALTALLERAGALEKLQDVEEQEPQTVVVDGVEYLEPAAKIEVRYRTTEAGQAMLDADRPADRLHEVLERDAVYKPIYLRILKACDEEGGKTAKELGALVDSDPLVQQPRFWAAHFFNILGECDALIWNRTWQTTDLGRAAIEELELEGVSA